MCWFQRAVYIRCVNIIIIYKNIVIFVNYPYGLIIVSKAYNNVNFYILINYNIIIKIEATKGKHALINNHALIPDFDTIIYYGVKIWNQRAIIT